MISLDNPPPAPAYVLPSRSFGRVMLEDDNDIRLDVLVDNIAAIDTAGTPCARAGMISSGNDTAKSASPDATEVNAPWSPGCRMVTSMPAFSYRPFCLAR